MEAKAQGWPAGIWSGCPGEQRLVCSWSRADLEEREQAQYGQKADWSGVGAGRCYPGLPGGPSCSKKDTRLSEAWSWRSLSRSQVGLRPMPSFIHSRKLKYGESYHPPDLLIPHWDCSLDPLSHMLLREPARRPLGRSLQPTLSPGQSRSTLSSLGTLPWADSPFVLHFRCHCPEHGGHLPLCEEEHPGLAITPVTSDQ